MLERSHGIVWSGEQNPEVEGRRTCTTSDSIDNRGLIVVALRLAEKFFFTVDAPINGSINGIVNGIAKVLYSEKNVGGLL